MSVGAGVVRRASAVIATRVADNGGDSGSAIGIRRDERTELGSSMVRVEFVVDFFPDELCE